ncbi:XRE family transcriptional regulator [Leuconostoc citreum]|uniref:helix-turn-helix domain-containing protein n=1 Tax=Leuconostoc citreum TaxID=33964 RepID=UPI0002466465|nr:helix-turn-helix transcriptional regulator [Leuconostoc citreum]MBA5939052.1 helix-turn-helix transcriptional regulator [Leuconostoc citreum]MCT3069899.1 XRE family transcriptional regulator [Leuconostoc citreum]CCF24386.1 Bacteriophage transcriptional regulator [Leuconostoc citreum LBAE C10]
MTTFERIKNTAKSRGLNLKQVAIASGMSENAIYRYNQGVEPSGPAIKAIAETLNVSTNYLLGMEQSSDKRETKKVDILDDETILAFDGMEIEESEKEKLRDYARYIISLREKENK